MMGYFPYLNFTWEIKDDHKSGIFLDVWLLLSFSSSRDLDSLSFEGIPSASEEKTLGKVVNISQGQTAENWDSFYLFNSSVSAVGSHPHMNP